MDYCWSYLDAIKKANNDDIIDGSFYNRQSMVLWIYNIKLKFKRFCGTANKKLHQTAHRLTSNLFISIFAENDFRAKILPRKLYLSRGEAKHTPCHKVALVNERWNSALMDIKSWNMQEMNFNSMPANAQRKYSRALKIMVANTCCGKMQSLLWHTHTHPYTYTYSHTQTELTKNIGEMYVCIIANERFCVHWLYIYILQQSLEFHIENYI